MKSLKFLLFTFAVLLSTGSVAQNYGPWQTTCYKGLDYCVMKKSCENGKCEWRVKFRNRYQDVINFSYAIKENSVTTSDTNKRIAVRANSESAPDWEYLSETFNPRIFIGKVKFGKDNAYGGPYVPCGN